MQVQIEYYFAIYNALVDDDEEIRAIGARTAIGIVHNLEEVSETNEVVPYVAARMLCTYMIDHFSGSQALFSTALGKVLGQKTDGTALRSVDNILKDTLQVDNSLFGEEKQNLYIDETREAELWSRVLKQCSLPPISQQVLDKFSSWVLDGIDCLTLRARKEAVGPLGWATKPDVLTLGIRVIFVAELLLHWRTQTKKVKVRGSTLRLKLHEFAMLDQQAELPGPWLRQIERVLQESVSKRILRVATVLQTLPLTNI